MSSWTPLRSTTSSTNRFSSRSQDTAAASKNGKENQRFLTPQGKRAQSRYLTSRSDSLRKARKSDANTKPGSPNVQRSSNFRTPLSATPKARGTSQSGTPECYSKVEFDTPCTPRMRRGSYRASASGTPSRASVSGTPSRFEDNSVDEDGFSVTVAVRVRPFSQK